MLTFFGREDNRSCPPRTLAGRVGNHSRVFGLLAVTGLALVLSACGGGSSSASNQKDPQIAGNWQFTLTPTAGTLFNSSPLQGGFLLQKNGAITGQVGLSLVLPPVSHGASPTTCNSGTANITGTMTGQTVSLTAVYGTLDQNGNPTQQTITLTGGTLTPNGALLQSGTYTVSGAGYGLNSSGTLIACGTAQDTGTWTAVSVPPLTGGFEGFFHSTQNTQQDQSFPVTGTLTQGPNIGSSTATVTGTLLFQDPVTLLNDYPCASTASVNGTISGNTVLLQIFGTSGTVIGQIGQSTGQAGVTPVTFDNTQTGYVLHNVNGAGSGSTGGGYILGPTKSCSSQDTGNLCLALGSSTACKQPITLTPFGLTFAPQLVGSAPTSQTITLTNNSGADLSGATLRLNSGGLGSTLYSLNASGEFNGVPNFTEQDNCVQQGTISLAAGSSCTITVSFSPQQSCTWIPNTSNGGIAPAQCPAKMTGSVIITVPSGSADADKEFAVPFSGQGLSAVVPSVPELDFSSEALGESSPPQTLTFINQGTKPVTIAPSLPCTYHSGGFAAPEQPRPPFLADGTPQIGGLQLAETGNLGISTSTAISYPQPLNLMPPVVNAPTVSYFCETDPPPANGGSGLPNFQLSSDTCSGQTLQPFGQSGNTCSVDITFLPQPETYQLYVASGQPLDDFLQLNTAWCGDANNPAEPNCEVDSGRFPVEIKTEPPSPLRMIPAASLYFGYVLKGTASKPLTLTIFNDPTDPNTATVTFASNVQKGADFLEPVEANTCVGTLAPNQSCSLTVTFIPSVVGFDQGSITITYSTPTQAVGVQTIYLRGYGQ